MSVKAVWISGEVIAWESLMDILTKSAMSLDAVL